MPPSEQPYLLQERLISGRGLIKIPPSDSYRHLYLYINVIRLPRTNFTSSKYNPDKSDYGKITWVRSGYTLRENSINYENQLIEWAVDPTGYLSSYLVCAYASVMGYLDYLAPFIPAPPLPTNPLDRIWAEPLKSTPSEIKIVCRGDTAISARLYALKYDVTCLDATPAPKTPPDPSPLASAPAGTGIGTSPAYDGLTDGGDTIRNSLDELESPPPARLRVYYHVAPGVAPNGQHSDIFVDFDVPDDTYRAYMVDGASPSFCGGYTLPEFTYASGTSGSDVLLFTHNTCNLLSITNQEILP